MPLGRDRAGAISPLCSIDLQRHGASVAEPAGGEHGAELRLGRSACGDDRRSLRAPSAERAAARPLSRAGAGAGAGTMMLPASTSAAGPSPARARSSGVEAGEHVAAQRQARSGPAMTAGIGGAGRAHEDAVRRTWPARRLEAPAPCRGPRSGCHGRSRTNREERRSRGVNRPGDLDQLQRRAPAPAMRTADRRPATAASRSGSRIPGRRTARQRRAPAARDRPGRTGDRDGAGHSRDQVDAVAQCRPARGSCRARRARRRPDGWPRSARPRCVVNGALPSSATTSVCGARTCVVAT